MCGCQDSWRDLYRSLKPLYLALWKEPAEVDALIKLRREVQKEGATHNPFLLLEVAQAMNSAGVGVLQCGSW